MSNLLKSLVIGTATGLATAYFLSTEKGKEVKSRAEQAYNAYKENPEEYRQMAKEKGTEYSNLAKETFNDYKHKFETGEITPEQVMEVVKEKTSQFVNKTSQQFTDEDNMSNEQTVSSDDVVLAEEDVIIDYIFNCHCSIWICQLRNKFKNTIYRYKNSTWYTLYSFCNSLLCRCN